MTQLFGYDKIEKQLLDNFREDKLHHALMLCGNRGIGKASFAYKLADKIIARGVNDSDSQNHFNQNNSGDSVNGLFGDIQVNDINDDDAIIDSDNHNHLLMRNPENNPNLLVIQREANQKQELKRDITIDSVRKINDFMNLTAATSNNRVILIDAVDEMNKNSANAILKALEEPSDSIFFLLINHNSKNIPITIKSRCNVIKVPALSFENFCQAVQALNTDIEQTQLKPLFKLSQGSIALAIELYEHDALTLYDEFLSVLNNKSKSTNLISKVTNKDFPWTIFNQLINLHLNQALKSVSRVSNLEYISNKEEEYLNIYRSKVSLERAFNIKDNVQKLLSDTKFLTLDKKHSLTNIINILK